MEIDIAKQFSPYPSGRVPSDGSFNGERFREQFLLPSISKLSSGEKLVVDIDGVRSFGSSFLEEAFAGLIRLGYISREDFFSKVEIRCTKPHLYVFRNAIVQDINAAVAVPKALHA